MFIHVHVPVCPIEHGESQTGDCVGILHHSSKSMLWEGEEGGGEFIHSYTLFDDNKTFEYLSALYYVNMLTYLYDM